MSVVLQDVGILADTGWQSSSLEFDLGASITQTALHVETNPRPGRNKSALSTAARKDHAMTHRIGNKDVAQQRSKADKKEIKRANIAREAVKKEIAKEKYRNAVKGRPGLPMQA
jgi:hypothetical protein